ncbi:hypothetical protein CEQ90_16105 [Lewinellaceae bacterium SD302]|nr:hypothetical protein CEQ90_16105 [Lewinellaceae bacterium SD302]
MHNYIRYFFYLASAACFALLVFNNLGIPELEFFDEARRGVNALEMYAGKSHPLVPSYAGYPDEWGTKPPILVWLQTLCLNIMGPGEVPIRLPSALATLLAIGLMVWFTTKQWGSATIGVIAGWILLLNWRLIGNHGARSGDFDALMLLFTLSQLLFFARFVETKRTLYLILSALAVLLAGWTKGIVCGFVLPAIAIYVLADPKARAQLLNWRMYVAYALALAGVVSYYFLREQVNPGYIQLVFDNELGGRFAEVNEQHDHPWYHYLWVMGEDKVFTPFIYLFPGALIFMAITPGRFTGVRLIGLGAVVFWAVITSSATKLFWYIVPAYPLISLVNAAFLYRCFGWMTAGLRSQLPRIHPEIIATLLIIPLFLPGFVMLIRKTNDPRAHMGMRKVISSYRAGIEDQSMQAPYTVISKHYHPVARFYAEKERLKGRDISFQPIDRVALPLISGEMDYIQLEIGQRVMMCEKRSWDWMAKGHRYKELAKKEHCKLVEITDYRLDNLKERHWPEALRERKE